MKTTLIAILAFISFGASANEITLLKSISVSSSGRISSEGRNLEYRTIDGNSCYLGSYNAVGVAEDFEAGSKLIITSSTSDVYRTETFRANGVTVLNIRAKNDEGGLDVRGVVQPQRILFKIECFVSGISKIAVTKKLVDTKKAVNAFSDILKQK